MIGARIEGGVVLEPDGMAQKARAKFPAVGPGFVRRGAIEGIPIISSVWSPYPAELACLVAGGNVQVSVIGDHQPPIVVGATAPPDDQDIRIPPRFLAWTEIVANGSMRVIATTRHGGAEFRSSSALGSADNFPAAAGVCIEKIMAQLRRFKLI